MTQTFSVVTVTLEDRPGDDGLRVYSTDLPGLILSGSDRDAVCDAILPSIKAIFEHRGISDLHIYPARPLSEVLDQDGKRDVAMHIQQFIVEMRRAA